MNPLRSRRFLLAAVPAMVLVALMTGIPTELVPNPWFSRMTPVRPLDVGFWLVLSGTAGALLATYTLPGSRAAGRAGSRGVGTSVVSVFAIGCPICNKLVIALLGVSGALTWFAPLQPILGFAAIAFSVWALRVRLRGLTRPCAFPVPVAAT